jgi:hypothetical protein
MIRESHSDSIGSDGALASAKSLLKLRKQLSGSPALAVAAGLQRLEDADEVLIADPLKLTDRQAARLLVRLSGDFFDEILIEVDEVGELGAHREPRVALGVDCAQTTATVFDDCLALTSSV